jgi:hypothetical protein
MTRTAFVLFCLLILSAIPRALAYDEERARANTIGDYSSCAAFYAVGATCIARTDFGPDATEHQLNSLPIWKAHQEALRQSLVVMKTETAMARFKLYYNEMMTRMDHDCGNIASLIVEYDFCKQLIEEGPEQRLEYWRSKQ